MIKYFENDQFVQSDMGHSPDMDSKEKNVKATMLDSACRLRKDEGLRFNMPAGGGGGESYL